MMYRVKINAKTFLLGVALVAAGVCGYRYIYVPYALEREMAQAAHGAKAAIEKYPFIETTLDTIASRFADQGNLLGHDRKWKSVISADAESFQEKTLARDFLKQHHALTHGGAQDFFDLHAEQVRSDIITLPNEIRDEDSLLAMQKFVILANRLYEICEIKEQFCNSTPEVEAIHDWENWFKSSAAAGEYYIVHEENLRRIEIKPLPKAFVTVCNFSPYPSRHLLVSAESNELRRVGDWFDLQAGECNRRMDVFFDGDPSFHVHSNIGPDSRDSLAYMNDVRRRQLISEGYTPDEEFLSGIEFQAWGNTLSCSTSEEVLAAKPAAIMYNCGHQDYHGRFSPAYLLDDSGEWYYFFEHPDFLLYQANENIQFAIRSATRSAREIAKAILWQRFYDREWQGEVPFSPGGEFLDMNGPLAPGIQLTNATGSDLYGRPLGLRSGDIITAMNGQAVYGLSDAHQILIEHGLSRDHGIEVPVKYSIFRDGNYYKLVESTYFFNPYFRSNSADQSGVAFWYGLGDAVAFGQTPEITCYGGVAGLFALNLLSGAIDGASSWINDRPFDKSSLNAFEYYDADECNWQKHQNRALARQMRDDIYHDSQWFAVISPSAIRMLGGKALTRNVQRHVGTSVGTRLSGAALELVESSLWSFGTEPPGTPISERLSSIKKFAPLAAAGVVLPH